MVGFRAGTSGEEAKNKEMVPYREVQNSASDVAK